MEKDETARYAELKTEKSDKARRSQNEKRRNSQRGEVKMKKDEVAKKTKTNVTEIVRAILKSKKVKQKDLALMIGRSANAVTNLLYSEGLSVGSLYRFVTVLGYEIVIQPKKPGRRPEGQYVVEAIESTAEADSCSSDVNDEVKEPPKKPITLESFQRRDY